MPAPSKLHSCEECPKQYTSKRGLAQHNVRKHATSKRKPQKETVSSKDITLLTTVDTAWVDKSADIAQQFCASIVQNKSASKTVKDLVEQSLYILEMDVLHFHMMCSLIDQQIEEMARNRMVPTFQKQIHLTNILTGMFNHYSRTEPIGHWRHVILWFSFATHLLKERPHFENSIRDFLEFVLRKIEWNTARMGGWKALSSWAQFVNDDRLAREQIRKEREQNPMGNELNGTLEA